MGGEHAAYLLAIAVGLVSSGLVASLWGMATGEQARLGLILDPHPGLLTPFRVFVVLFSAPTTVLLDAFDWLIHKPFVGVPLLVAALVWSFFQGVFILTQLFGLG